MPTLIEPEMLLVRRDASNQIFVSIGQLKVSRPRSRVSRLQGGRSLLRGPPPEVLGVIFHTHPLTRYCDVSY
ncbi:MAG: hypothetical protein ACR2JJ_07810 [Sphingomicrobium sp.]